MALASAPTAVATAEAASVAVSGLRFDAGGRRILDLPDWSVAPGEQALLLGPSGSGKTTLLSLLAGLLRPTAGSVAIAGRDLAGMRRAELDVFRGRQVGIVFQSLHLVGALSVAGNLRLARYLAKLPVDGGDIGRLLDALGIADKATALPAALSQGEAQRVAIARALINAPALLLADEPTSALDDANCHQVVELLRRQAAAHGATLLIATHDQRLKDVFPNRLDLPARP